MSGRGRLREIKGEEEKKREREGNSYGILSSKVLSGLWLPLAEWPNMNEMHYTPVPFIYRARQRSLASSW